MANIVLQRNLNEYNVKDFGAMGNGTNDDTTFITNAINAAVAAGGGIVFFPAGTYLSGNQTIASYVTIAGAGVGATTIKLKNGANTDLFSAFTSSINLAGANGTGSATGAVFFGFKNLTLDGNKANQSSGPSYPVRTYGYGHVFEHVEIRSGYSGNVLLDWNGGANPTAPNNAYMPHWYDVMSHDCNGMAIEIGGPTDQQWIAVSGFASGSHVCHVAPNCVALRMAHCHFWATPLGVSATTLLNEAAELVLSSCQIEGSDTCALVLLGNDCQASDLEVGSTADASRAGRGIQMGQNAGNTPYAGQVYQSGGHTTSATANVCHLSGKCFDCNTGALDEENTTGNIYILNIYQTSGTGIYSNGGYLGGGSTAIINVQGLTPDGTPGKGGTFQVSNAFSFNGVQVYDQAGNALFVINTMPKASGGGFNINNGYALGMFSDNGSTYTLDFANNANGQIWFGSAFDTYIQKGGAGVMQIGNAAQLGSGSTLYSGSGAPSNANGNNGDYYFRTDTPGTANQRLYVKSSGSWTGVV